MTSTPNEKDLDVYYFSSDSKKEYPDKNSFLDTKIEKIFNCNRTIKKYLNKSVSLINLFNPRIDCDRNKLLIFLWKNRLIGRHGNIEGYDETQDTLEWKELQKQKELKVFIDHYLVHMNYKYLVFKVPSINYSLSQILKHLGFDGAYVNAEEGDIFIWNNQKLLTEKTIELNNYKTKGVYDVNKISKMLK